MQLTVKQAAELLQTSEAAVRKWIRDRGLPAVTFNEQYRLNRIDLLVWAQQNQIPVPPQALTPHESGSVSLHASLQRGGIHRDLAGTSGAEVLRALLERVALPPGADRDLLLEMVLARQAQGSTEVGNGIAIPHARYPIVIGAAEPILALGFVASAVDFGMPGGARVHTLFLLLTPTAKSHLNLLARLARALGAELLDAVRARADDAAILAAAHAGDVAADRAAARSSAP